MINLGRSRPFQQSIVAIYWIVLPLLLLSAAGAAVANDMSGRWPLVAGLLVGATFVGWRLWLYRRALGIATGVPPVRRLALIWLPLGVLALGGFTLVAAGLAWMVVPSMLMSDPVAKDALGGWIGVGVIGVVGLIPIAIGGALTAPLVLALKRRRAAQSAVVASSAGEEHPSDEAPTP